MTQRGLSTPAAVIMTILFVVGMVGVAVQESYVPPPQTIVIIDDAQRVYYAPPCLARADTLPGGKLARARRMSIEGARELGYRGDYECVQDGAFIQDGRSLLGSWLEDLGVLRPMQRRWNVDGSWNW